MSSGPARVDEPARCQSVFRSEFARVGEVQILCDEEKRLLLSGFPQFMVFAATQIFFGYRVKFVSQSG
jgi:hypothetical protein